MRVCVWLCVCVRTCRFVVVRVCCECVWVCFLQCPGQGRVGGVPPGLNRSIRIHFSCGQQLRIVGFEPLYAVGDAYLRPTNSSNSTTGRSRGPPMTRKCLCPQWAVTCARATLPRVPVATWPRGNVATWRRGNVATWACVATWQRERGNVATWPRGHVATWTWQRGHVATLQRGHVPTWHVAPWTWQRGRGNVDVAT